MNCVAVPWPLVTCSPLTLLHIVTLTLYFGVKALGFWTLKRWQAEEKGSQYILVNYGRIDEGVNFWVIDHAFQQR